MPCPDPRTTGTVWQTLSGRRYRATFSDVFCFLFIFEREKHRGREFSSRISNSLAGDHFYSNVKSRRLQSAFHEEIRISFPAAHTCNGRKSGALSH